MSERGSRPETLMRAGDVTDHVVGLELSGRDVDGDVHLIPEPVPIILADASF